MNTTKKVKAYFEKCRKILPHDYGITEEETEEIAQSYLELQKFYDRHHEDRSGDYTTYIDDRPDCECIPCKSARGIIKHLQTLAQELKDERDRYKKALEEIEWQAHDHFCYVCTAEKCKGHFPDCPIGKALSPDTNDH